MLPATATHLFEYRVVGCGELAWHRLGKWAVSGGRVAAVFKSTFYVDLGGDLGSDLGGEMVCVVGADCASAPLNLISDVPRTVCWPSHGLACGMTVRLSQNGMIVDERFRFHLDGARVWRPPPPPQCPSQATLRIGLSALRETLEVRAPDAGLARSLCRPASASVGDRRRQRDRALLEAVARALSDTVRDGPLAASVTEFAALLDLVGRGDGLTPSGDDFIGGVMLALHAAGRLGLRDQIRDAVLAVATYRTNAISLAHLTCAAQGLAAEPVHNLIHAVMVADIGEITSIADDIDQLGHTSGWDIVAGVACALAFVAGGQDTARKTASRTNTLAAKSDAMWRQ